MSEWKEYRLGDVINLKRGHDLPSFRRIQGHFPILSSSGVTGWHHEYKEKGPGVVTGRYGTIGEVFYVESEYWPLNTTLYVQDFKKNIPKYIYYFLKTFNFHKYNDKSTVPGINRNHLHEEIVAVPSLETQTAIAEILSSLDDKIELNNKINQELETLAQTLFKQWFIDFEFPNVNGEPYKSSGGEMVESELGKIPKGWEVKSLKDEFVLNMGQSPKGDTYNTNGDGLIFFQGRSDFGFRFPSIRMYTNDPKKIAKKFETLISVRAPVGDINMASEDCCIGRGLGSISHPQKLYSYTYHKILSIQDELKSYDNEGTVFGSINKETLGNIKNILPPIEICKLFNDLSVDKDSLIFSLAIECQELVKTRDTLLPKLISGELEINEIANECQQ